MNRNWTGPLEWKHKDGFLEVNGVKGYLLPGDAQVLYRFAERMPLNAKILEVGSFFGLSSLIISRALYGAGKLGAKLYCVDTWEGSPEHQSMKEIQGGHLFDIFKSNISESGLAQAIVPIRKDSAAAAVDFPAQSLDMIFIDGDHSFNGCFSDLVAWYPKLKPGGIFIGHDGAGDVRRAVEIFLSKNQELSSIVLGVPPYSNFMYRLVKREAVFT